MDKKKAVVIGLANDKSIAFGVAKGLIAAGYDVAATYQNEKTLRFVQEPADRIGISKLFELDVTADRPTLEHVFWEIGQWAEGEIDVLVHSVAFAPAGDLNGRVMDVTPWGFEETMDISAYSLIRVVKAAEDLMAEGGSIFAMSYLGANRVVPGYGIMGVAKAALEAIVRYLAHEMRCHRVRVNAVSPGPIETRAAGGIKAFGDMLGDAHVFSLNGLLPSVDDVGEYVAALASPACRSITGQVLFMDGGTSARGL